MKVLLTGARGMLGQGLLHVLSKTHQVFPFTRHQMDITDSQQVLACISEYRPHLVINAGAYTDVDVCQEKRDLAFQVNALGPKNLAVACRHTDSILLQISSDYVFSGTKMAPYVEDDRPDPINVYGQSKLAGEQYVRSTLERHFIVRSAWLFGPGGTNFIQTIMEKIKKCTNLSVVNDQVGSPTYTLDLALAIQQLISQDDYGTYHLTNGGHCSWYELARLVVDLAQRPGVSVKPIDSRQLNRPAPRPAFSVLDNYCWRRLGKRPLRPYQEAVKEYLGQLGA